MIRQDNQHKSTHPAQDSLIDHWVDKAQQHYQRQNKSVAKYWAEKVTKIDLDNTLALNLLGRIALDDNRLDDACTLLNKALIKAPSDSSTLLNLGYTYLAMADYQRADDVFDVILDFSPNNTKARISIAYSQLLQEQFEVALSLYRKLYREGVSNPHIISGMADCCAQLKANSYLPELELDLISLYRHIESGANIQAEQLSSLTQSLLIHKYDLTNENSQINIQELTSDKLLIASIEHGSVNCAEVESLIVAIRASILLEAHATNQINNHHLAMAHAISCQSAANGYLFAHSQDESIAIEVLRDKIESAMLTNWSTEELTGALLLLSLYEPLDTQTFAWRIAKYDLADWPLGIQKVMSLHFYQAQERLVISHELINSHDNKINGFENNDLFPKAKLWQTLTHQGASSYVHAIQNELQNTCVATHKIYKHSRALIVGCDAGLNALSLAYNYPELSIVATEPTIEGLSHAILKAHEYQLSNIEFRIGDLEQIINNEQFDFIECGNYFNFVDEINSPLHQLLSALNPEGVIKLGLNKQSQNQELKQMRDFVKEKDLTKDHTHIRALRSAILEDHKISHEWIETIQSNWFYHYRGCINQLFSEQKHFNEKDVTHLCQLHDLHFLGFSQVKAPIKEDKINTGDNQSMDFYASKFNTGLEDMIFIKPAVMI